jgi:DNA-binding transcriptional LysR family regulator
LGAPLVVRSARGLQLSELGSRLLPHVQQALAAVDAMRDELGGFAGLSNGSLRISAVPSIAGTILPKLIREFNARYPGIEVSLFEGTDIEVAEWVRNRVAQVGFAALPIAGLNSKEIARDEWLAVVPAADAAGQDRITLKALARRRFILSGGGCEVHIARLFEEAGVEPVAHLSVKELTTIHAMVAEGLGVSILPELAVRKQSRGIRTLKLSPRRFRRIGLLQPNSASATPSVQAWLALVATAVPAASRRRRTDPA